MRSWLFVELELALFLEIKYLTEPINCFDRIEVKSESVSRVRSQVGRCFVFSSGNYLFLHLAVDECIILWVYNYMCYLDSLF